LRIRPLHIWESGAFNHWMGLPRGDREVDGVVSHAAAWWTGRYRRLVGIELGRRFWRWWR
jgi:hypothetical protein